MAGLLEVSFPAKPTSCTLLAINHPPIDSHTIPARNNYIILTCIKVISNIGHLFTELLQRKLTLKSVSRLLGIPPFSSESKEISDKIILYKS